MRWERLFADLAAEIEATESAELESEIADRTRSERARLRLVDRLRGSVGRPLTVRVAGVGAVAGALRAVGADWFLVRPDGGADRLVRTEALLEVAGLAPSSAAEETGSMVAARYSLAAVLRGLARDRTVVTMTLVDGSARTGVIEVVGADLVEISDRRYDEPGLAVAPGTSERRTVPLVAVAMIREH